MPQWEPKEAGIKLVPIPGAPDPADSPAKRLIQMRRIAREFSATSTANDGTQTVLRLLSQPLYRYQSKSAKVTDGGLFGLVYGTDPELLLIIEAREEAGHSKWHFAAARCTGLPLNLKHKDKTVWQCEKAKTWVGDRLYFFCVGVSEHDADVPMPKSTDPDTSPTG